MMELRKLSDSGFWRGLGGADGTLALSIVMPSGRATASDTPHLALSSDGLYLPEIAIEVDRLARSAGASSFSVRSMLDIDYYENLRQGPPPEDNLVVVGSAAVNLISEMLLEKCESWDRWRAGFPRPYGYPGMIVAADGRRFSFTGSPNVGILAMYENPWSASPRVALLCAGSFAIGTAASLRLALEYLRGDRREDNETNPSIPLKIIDARARDYRHLELKSVHDCSPQMDVRNILSIRVLE
ncbi:hypothetical protein [Frankia sp. R43]|uniref:hypothetical protein n=1 Tax=Frankia sp. R43 TaxID=269536 RepID=UPI00128FAFC4|nr:hypothetical protein [Frankia sp. R43]